MEHTHLADALIASWPGGKGELWMKQIPALDAGMKQHKPEITEAFTIQQNPSQFQPNPESII